MSHDSPTPHLPSLTPSCLRVPIRPQPPLPSSPDLAHSHPLRLGNEQIAHQPLPSPLPRIQLSVSPPHSARILPPCARIFAPSARIFPLSARIFPPSARIFPPSARVSPLSACAALPRRSLVPLPQSVPPTGRHRAGVDQGLFPTLLLPPSPNIPPLSTPTPRSLPSDLNNLNNKGLKQANSVLLTGCSAGAIAVSMACDAMAQFHFPRTAKVKCLMDAGFFMDTPDITGQYSFRGIVQRMFRFHSMTAAADDDCRTVLFILHLTPFPFPLFIPSLSSIKSFPPQF
ncbi:unnamed protein product [Closterium sp. Naga37s-1]|nr:unnamed protein product [Closterium sp. Naga37s-1]